MTVRLAAMVIAAVMGYVAVPIPVLAQSTDRSGIQGKVADQTGAILPGVTVTIASPALVAGRQVTHADAEGHYQFTALHVHTFDRREPGELERERIDTASMPALCALTYRVDYSHNVT